METTYADMNDAISNFVTVILRDANSLGQLREISFVQRDSGLYRLFVGMVGWGEAAVHVIVLL